MIFLNEKEREQYISNNMGIAQKVLSIITQRHGYTYCMYEDLLQEAYILLTEAADKYDPVRGVAFSTFAWTYIHNGLINIIKDCYNTSQQYSLFDKPEMIDDVADVTEDFNYSSHIKQEDLQFAMSTLTERQRYVINERFMKKRKLKDIAAELSITPQAAEKLMRKAFKKMRKHIHIE